MFVALGDLMYVAKGLIGLYYKTDEALFMLVISYLLILLPISLILGLIERKVRYAGLGELVFYLKEEILFRLLEGLGVTLEISLLSVLVSMILGTGMGVLMSMNSKVIRFICRIYLNIVRIIPQLVLLFLAYFGLSKSFGVNLSGELAAVLVFFFLGNR